MCVHEDRGGTRTDTLCYAFMLGEIARSTDTSANNSQCNNAVEIWALPELF